MERIEDDIDAQMSAVARTLLILNNYEWLRNEADSIGVKIIPLKGIELLQTIYAKTFDRNVRDIDIMCLCEEDCRRLVTHLCKDDYRLKFPFSMTSEVLNSKKKVSLLSCNLSKVNIDIHINLVTKRSFSMSIGSFNQNAIQRCKDGALDPIDRWLFLAQHASFHMFSDHKWTRDLELLIPSCGNVSDLIDCANKYGFKRVLLTALYHISKNNNNVQSEFENKLKISASEKRFLKFVRLHDRPMSRNPKDRLIIAFWEFVLIQQNTERLRALGHLILPSLGNLRNIYLLNSAWSAILFYPINLLVSITMSIIFWLYYGYTVFIRRS